MQRIEWKSKAEIDAMSEEEALERLAELLGGKDDLEFLVEHGYQDHEHPKKPSFADLGDEGELIQALREFYDHLCPEIDMVLERLGITIDPHSWNWGNYGISFRISKEGQLRLARRLSRRRRSRAT